MLRVFASPREPAEARMGQASGTRPKHRRAFSSLAGISMEAYAFLTPPRATRYPPMSLSQVRLKLLSLPRPWKWLGGAIAAFLLYAILSALLVPRIVRRQVTQAARNDLHREATLTKVRFNPFTLKTTLIGFDLRDLDGTPLLAFDTMVVDLALASIPRRALSLDAFRLIRPAVVVRIASDGRLAVADLLEPDSTASSDSAGVPRLHIAHLGIAAGELIYLDESRTPTYQERFSDLGLTVEGLSTLPNRSGDHVLTANFATGAQLRWSGRNSVDPVELDGEVTLTGVQLPRVAEVLSAQPLQLVRGLGDLSLRYTVRHIAGQGMQLTVPIASLSATDIALRPAEVENDWARLARLDVSGINAQWPERSLNVARVELREPWLRAGRLRDGTLDWTQYLDGAAPRENNGVDTLPVDPQAQWRMRIDTLAIADGAIDLADNTVRPAQRFQVSAINVKLSPISNDSTVPVNLIASAAMGRRSRASVTGSMTQYPRVANLVVTATDIDLTQAQPYLKTGVPVKLVSGTLSLGGKLKLRETRPAMAFDGRATMNNVVLQDSASDSLLAWQSLKATGVRVTGEPNLVRVKKVAVERPFARIAISQDRILNLTTLVPPVDSTATDTASTPYEVEEVAFTNGLIDFSDLSLILPFRARIDSTWGSIRDVANFGGTAGALQLEGKIDPYGLARATGTIRANDPFASTDIRADFRNVDMTTLTPYSSQFAGYSIKDGKLDVDLDYHIKDRMLKADHKIIATNLTLGDKVEGGEAPGFLVKLAVSLLKDKEGRIKLDVPVEGSVDSPEWSYKGVVWQAVKAILGNIAKAPFKLLGKLFGIGGDDIELVDFDPGRTDVIPPEKEKLDSLAAEMGRKPELLLFVEGRYDSISDVAALREASLQRKISAQRDSLGKKTQSDTSTTMLARIMDALYVSQFGEAARDSLEEGFKEAWKSDTTRTSKKYDPAGYYTEIRTRLLAAQPVAAGELERLGSERAQAVALAVASGGIVDSSRVTVEPPVPVKRKKAGSSRIASEMKLDAK